MNKYIDIGNTLIYLVLRSFFYISLMDSTRFVSPLMPSSFRPKFSAATEASTAPRKS